MKMMGCILLCFAGISAVATTPTVVPRELDDSFNSQHFLNGTTAVERSQEGSRINMHLNQAHKYDDESVPLLNYTNFFNRPPQYAISVTSGPPSARDTTRKSLTRATTTDADVARRREIECGDDKVELDYLHFHAITLENNLTRMAIDYNFTLIKYDECKLDRKKLENKLNFTTESWNSCKRFCEVV